MSLSVGSWPCWTDDGPVCPCSTAITAIRSNHSYSGSYYTHYSLVACTQRILTEYPTGVYLVLLYGGGTALYSRCLAVDSLVSLFCCGDLHDTHKIIAVSSNSRINEVALEQDGLQNSSVSDRAMEEITLIERCSNWIAVPVGPYEYLVPGHF